VRWTTRFKFRTRPNPRDPLPEHVAVRDAIAAGQPDTAHAAMAELLHLALIDMGVPERA